MKRYFFIVLVFPLLFAAASIQAQDTEQPNIVVLFADDLGYSDLGSYGHPTIRTPNLDRMARQGFRMTSFYAFPSCSPARGALMTGRYPTRTGMTGVVGPDQQGGLNPDEVVMAEALKAEGYQTQAVGKWHLGHLKKQYLPTSNGFDHYFGLPYSNDMIPPWVGTDRPLRFYGDDGALDGEVDQSKLTTRYTSVATDFIQEASDSQEPFFLYLAYSMPHLPIDTTDRFSGRSRAGLYGDVIETIDWSAGQILQSLEKAGVDGETIVVFTSDNGPWSNMPGRMKQGGNKAWHAGFTGILRGAKGTTWEGGVRVPAIVRWPGEIPAGRRSAGIAALMDLYTTLVLAGGGEVPDDRPVDGLNLMPWWKGKQEHSPRDEFFYFRGGIDGVRRGPWKFRKGKLFHLGRDPGEQYDVSGNHPDIVKELKQMVRDYPNSAQTYRE